jgi:hypothetical protein
VTSTASAATGAVLAALLVAAALLSSPLVATATVLLAVVALAVGWPALLALPSPRGTAAVVALAGAAGVITVLLTPGPARLRLLPPVLALAVLGAFLHQLLRRDLRPRVVDGLSGAISGLLLAALASGWLAALGADRGEAIVVTGAAAAAVGSLALLLPPRPGLRALAAVVAPAVVAGLVGALAHPMAVVPSGVLGLAVGLVIAVVQAVLALLPTVRERSAWASLAAAPVAACGLAVYAVGRVVMA